MRLGERGQADTAADGAKVREVVVPAEAGTPRNRPPKGARVSLWGVHFFPTRDRENHPKSQELQ